MKLLYQKVSLTLAWVALIGASRVFAQPVATNWPVFRGADQSRAGVRQGLPLHWSESSNIVWKVALADPGHSSPVCFDKKVFLTGASENGERLTATGIDFLTGKTLWTSTVFTPTQTLPKHDRNSHASPTPAVERGRLYVAFGTQGVACLDSASGAIIWKNNDHRIDHDQNGAGSSPMLHGDYVVINFDGSDTRSIVALHKANGTTAWKTPRSNPIDKPKVYIKAHSTPTLLLTGSGPQWISGGSYRFHGYEAVTGKELWHVDTPGFCPVPVPIVDRNIVYFCTGFEKSQLWAVRVPEGSGEAEVIWKHRRGVPLVSTPVLAAGRIYFVSDAGVASCLDSATGALLWEERLGGDFWASPIAADYRVYFSNQKGDTYVVDAADKFKILATNHLGGGLIATAAVSEESLLLRTLTHLYRIGSGKSARTRQ